MKDQVAVVGVGATDYYRRGQSYPRESELSMACKAILAALEDAGLTINDLDGFAMYSHGFEPAEMAAVLGVPEVRFCAQITGGGGASGAVVGLAAAAIYSGQATCVVSLMTVQQYNRRLGGSAVDTSSGSQLTYDEAALGIALPYAGFTANDGLLSQGHAAALIARRHMHKYGTTREHFAEVCMSTRANALSRPKALYRMPLTIEEYFNARHNF